MVRESSTRQTLLRLKPRALSWMLVSLLLFAPTQSWAQSASEKAAAEALFDQGVQLLKKGRYSEACKKLERSQAVEPGIGTLLYLGECYKKLGKTASAWATFREAASKAQAAGEEERARAGSSRADALEPELSYVSFEVAPETAELDGLKVVQGKNEVSPALFGTKVPVDPGELKVEARAPGHEPFEISIRIQKGPAETTISVPVLPALPESERNDDQKSTSQVAITNPTVTQPLEDDRNPGATQRGLGVGLGVVGVLAAGAGGVFGVLAIKKDSAADDVCDEKLCNPGSSGYDDSKNARLYGNISTVAIAAGATLAVGGLVLYLTAPDKKETALTLQPSLGGAQFSFGGVF